MMNSVAFSLKAVGIIEMVISVIFGFVFGNMGYDFEWAIFLTWSGIGIVFGLIFIGFATVIELLREIGRLRPNGINTFNHLSTENVYLA